MKKVTVGVLSAVFVCLMATNGFALTITDAGVVGTIDAGTQSSNVANEIDWAQFLLDLVGVFTTTAATTADGNNPVDGTTEIYVLGATDYSATLSGGTQVTPGIGTDLSAYGYVLGKYDGQNAGYILFNMADWGSNSIPEFSATIWGTGDKYQLSHATGFNRDVPPGGVIPEPGTVLLFGTGLAGLSLWRWKTAKKA